MIEKFKKVFLIDDDEIVVYLTNILLYKTGFADEVVTFTRSTEGLNELLKTNLDELPDLILLDINMPELDGWEFLDQLKKHHIKIPVFIITSSINPSDKTKGNAHKMVNGVISKPLTKNCLDKIKRLYESNGPKQHKKRVDITVSI
jgi:CheY-like chemotaxis protein